MDSGSNPQTASANSGVEASDPAPSKTPLDDVMIAMDVVDTLRHDRSLVERELNDEARRKDLIDRLRKIYSGQGIEVPDRILEEGVRALEENRFTYKPPDPNTLSTRLAKLYVTRGSWGRYVVGLAAGLAAFFLVNYLVFERPQHLKAEAEQHELTELIPARVQKLVDDIGSEASDGLVATRAEAIAKTGLNAASSGDLAAARKSEQQLTDTLEQLRAAYEIRIVNREGDVTGLWRIPKANPDTYNFYLVVEAIDANGKRVPQLITNEETGKRERVETWAVRVDRPVLVSVKADKDDDGIIQNNIAGRKLRGELAPQWSIEVQDGAITRWK
jgi:hypothetical protein